MTPFSVSVCVSKQINKFHWYNFSDELSNIYTQFGWQFWRFSTFFEVNSDDFFSIMRYIEMNSFFLLFERFKIMIRLMYFYFTRGISELFPNKKPLNQTHLPVIWTIFTKHIVYFSSKYITKWNITFHDW